MKELATLQDPHNEAQQLVLTVDEERPRHLQLFANGEQSWNYRHLFYLKTLKKQGVDHAAYEEWFLAGASHGDLLDYHNACPEVQGGQVVALNFYEDGDYDNPRQPTDEEFEALGLDPEDLGCVEPHPEGSDRGGYVPTLTNGCHWDECGGEWQG